MSAKLMHNMQNHPKILLISLRDAFLDSDRVMPPMGIMSLHALMLDRGIESTIENNFDFDNIKKYSSYTHFGISCMTPERDQAYEILAQAKKHLPNVVKGVETISKNRINTTD
jgi:hypothetical protein